MKNYFLNQGQYLTINGNLILLKHNEQKHYLIYYFTQKHHSPFLGINILGNIQLFYLKLQTVEVKAQNPNLNAIRIMESYFIASGYCILCGIYL